MGLRKLVKFICKGCKKEVELRRRPAERIYCSQQCFWKYYYPTIIQRLQHSKVLMGRPNKTRGIKRPHKSGAGNPNWRGGISGLDKILRTSMEYANWRKAVFKRDNYKCVLCGYDKGHILQADHIKAFAYYPELRFEVSNGRTLCTPCHRKTPNYGRRDYRGKGYFTPLSIESNS